MNKKIYLIRHGQTDFNLQGIVQGRGKDISLNALGKKQAAAFYHAYKSISFDAVYTSTLKRSIESVISFIDSGILHYALSGFDEIDWGIIEGQDITGTGDAYYQELVQQWGKGHTDLGVENGESPEDVAHRQKDAIQTVMGNEKEETILICMHGRAIRIFLCQLLRYPLRDMKLFPHQNLGLYVLHHTDSMWQIEQFNKTNHLEDIEH